MSLPKWIKPEISLGTIVSVVGLLAAMWTAAAAYGALGQRVDATASSLSSITVRLDAKDAADAALLAALNSDRVSLAGKLSEMATDIRYLRRSAEAEKRAELEP